MTTPFELVDRSRMDEMAIRLAIVFLQVNLKDESGKAMGAKSCCLWAVECADAMLGKIKEKENGR